MGRMISSVGRVSQRCLAARPLVRDDPGDSAPQLLPRVGRPSAAGSLTHSASISYLNELVVTITPACEGLALAVVTPLKAHLFGRPSSSQLPCFSHVMCKNRRMPSHELLRADVPNVPVVGTSRARVLDVLRAARAPLGVDDVAARVGLHPNTTRFHLDVLVTQGLVERASEERILPGRPRTLYAATAASARAGRRSYRLLAEILTSFLANRTKQPNRAAVQAGEAWGRYLTQRPAPFRRVDAATAVRRLVDTLDDIGFAPEAVTVSRERQILLHHCPFREMAEEHGEIVCSVHLGLMRGMLAELDAPVEAQRLEPVLDPGPCVAHIVKRPDGRRRPSATGRTSG
jgi:predicted ArsR family transcriptional regulator